MAIKIFQSERDAGLAEKLMATAAVAYSVPIQSVVGADESDNVKLSFPRIALATNLGQPDLYYLNTILASTVWNENDDVFDVVETWLARHTAEDKPFNLEHDCEDIIGHITNCCVVDADMNLVDDSITEFSKLPSKLHIVTSAVLYKVWQKPELQERMNVILEEIENGEWCVSMEAIFGGFDYAVRDASNNTRVVARSEETAFLTKYLRAYGGAGKYGDYTIGRVLRNIVFCGKGLVRKPANPESVVLDDSFVFDGRTSAKEIPEKFIEKISCSENPVYSGIAQGSDNENSESEQEMKTVEQLTAELTERDSTIASLQAAAATNKSTIESLQASLSEATGKIQTIEQSIKDSAATFASEKASLEAKVKELTTENEVTKASLNTANTELGAIKAKAQRAERLVVVANKLNANEADATKIVDSTISLDDAAFATQIEFMASAITEKVTAATKKVAAPVEPSVEDDPAEKVAAKEKLENVEPEKTVASLQVSDSVEAARASIVDYLKKSKGTASK